MSMSRRDEGRAALWLLVVLALAAVAYLLLGDPLGLLGSPKDRDGAGDGSGESFAGRDAENAAAKAPKVAVTLETGPIIRPESLPESLRRPRAPDAFHVDFPPEGIDLDKLMEQIERDLIRRALERVDGVQSRAAQLLGTGFRSFRYRLQKYGMIERGSGPDGGPDEPAQ